MEHLDRMHYRICAVVPLPPPFPNVHLTQIAGLKPEAKSKSWQSQQASPTVQQPFCAARVIKEDFNNA